ncbi:hypothetical protein HPB52_016215 [Rhipicephalus sanguineus]|uniref:T-complex protein 1 subunit gamma n=1 Tax=Rhipicephalus sanguineus TaxID=34632 RepID=A0A9D4SZ66_RHISA|nr:hypothetical protein HPB52_016215 [Rhipicephalus sanguineus]
MFQNKTLVAVILPLPVIRYGWYYCFITECEDPKACTILLRGASKDVLQEVERNLQDAMCVARNVILEPRLVPGGGAVEMAVGHLLTEKSKNLTGVQQWPYRALAKALEIIPATLIQNCGGNTIRTLTALKATSALIPAPDHPPDEVQEVLAAIGHSTESSVFSTASAHGPSDVPAICTSSLTSMAHNTSATSGSTTATSPHALESAIDGDIVTPTIRPPIAEASPAMMSDEPVFPSTSALCASCQQRPASPSQSLAAEVPAPNHRWPNFRDAATMTDAPEDDVPGQHTPELTAYATPATEADIQHADLRTSPREPTTVGASTSTGSPSEPAAETTPAQLHHRFPAEPLTQDTIHPTKMTELWSSVNGGDGDASGLEEFLHADDAVATNEDFTDEAIVAAVTGAEDDSSDKKEPEPMQAKHAAGEGSNWSIDGETGNIVPTDELKVWEPLVVKLQAYKTAIETAILLLRIDDIVSGSKKKGKGDGDQTPAQPAPTEESMKD